MLKLSITNNACISTFARNAAAMLVSGMAMLPAHAEDGTLSDGNLAAAPFVTLPVAPAENRTSSLPSLHSDLKFSVLAPPRKAVPDADDVILKAQTSRIAESLQAAARGLYADKMKSLGGFDVYIADSNDAETLSSATGKIALYGGIAQLKPADDWLAFVIAREMGHVLAGHHDQNSAASILTSVIMNLLIPGSGLIKSALSFAGAQAASASGGEKQAQEADEVALKLLEAAGYTARTVALNLAQGPLDERLCTSSWADSLRLSARTLVARQSAATPSPAPAFPSAPAFASASMAQTANDGATVAVAGLAGLGLGAGNASTPAAIATTATTATIAIPTTAAPTSMVSPAVALPTLRRGGADEMPLLRARPSGIAGPFMLGGYAVPVRRIE